MHIVHTLITSNGHGSFGEYCVSCVGLIIDGQMFCWSERYKMPNALTFLKCHINHKWIKGGQYPKGYLTWDQIKVGTKGWQSLAQRNKTRQFLLLSHLTATGIVLKIAKRKLAATQKKCNKEERMGRRARECELWVRWVGISHRQYRTLGACSLGENGHCGTNLQCKPGHQLDMRRPEMAS